MLVISTPLKDAFNVEAAPTRQIRWLLIVPAALGIMIANVGVHILYMVIFSYLIDPGHDVAYYESHAQFSAPYSSIVFGIPLMFFGCRWLAKKFAPQFCVTAALLVWVVYFLIDLSVMVLAAALGGLVLLFVISFVTKFAAAYLAGLSARRQLVAEV